MPSQSQVDLVCDFFNAPCGFRNFLRLSIPGARTVSYCNRNPNQIFRNQRLARITNTGNDRPMIISFIIPRFFSRSGQGVQCRVVSLGSSGTNPTSTTASPASTTQPAVSSTAPSAQACGIKGQGRIVGGNTATPNEWPWAVFLSIQTSAGSFFCGGSVISNRAVLTAAHCVEGAVSSVTVFFGCHQRSRADCDLVLTAPAQNVRPHPSYRNVGSGRDVAVIRLPQTITFTNTIRPVCLPTTPNNNFADNSLWVAGWGRTSTGGGLAPALKEVRMKQFLIHLVHHCWALRHISLLANVSCFSKIPLSLFRLRWIIFHCPVVEVCLETLPVISFVTGGDLETLAKGIPVLV